MKKLMKILAICTRGGYNDSGWVDCATLVNGAVPYSPDTSQVVKRRVLDFKKFKIVKIEGSISLPIDSVPTRVTTYINLPSGLAPGSNTVETMPGTGTTTVRWSLSPDGTTVAIDSLKLDPSISSDTIIWFPVDFTYISQ